MVTTTSPVAGVENEPVPRAIIVSSVCRSPFVVSNSRPVDRLLQRLPPDTSRSATLEIAQPCGSARACGQFVTLLLQRLPPDVAREDAAER
jgi:hypothetical protein